MGTIYILHKIYAKYSCNIVPNICEKAIDILYPIWYNIDTEKGGSLQWDDKFGPLIKRNRLIRSKWYVWKYKHGGVTHYIDVGDGTNERPDIEL